jgi:hypothetical protein
MTPAQTEGRRSVSVTAISANIFAQKQGLAELIPGKERPPLVRLSDVAEDASAERVRTRPAGGLQQTKRHERAEARGRHEREADAGRDVEAEGCDKYRPADRRRKAGRQLAG